MKRLLQGLVAAFLCFTFSLVLVRIISRPAVEQANRETVLRQSLRAMRLSIDQYLADRAQLPQSLEDLAAQGYIREIPADPMTGNRDWQVEVGEVEVGEPLRRSSGIVEVHSSSPGKSADGAAHIDF
jgi:general secretion pathway protein G